MMAASEAVLFADVSGSARLHERLGEAEAAHAVERCINRMERVIEGFGGRLLQAGGDEMMASFTSAEAACQAAIEMQERIADLPPVSGLQLAVRIGLHVGPVEGDLAAKTFSTAAHIVGLARSDQILASRQAVSALPGRLGETVRAAGRTPASSAGEQIFEVPWRKGAVPATAEPPPQQGPVPPEAAGKLCLRYRGRAYLLDDKTPILSLGRDAGNDVVIEDRKASRQHGRIEKRGKSYFYVDRSTNGSYVTSGGQPEALLRRAEVQLQGKGAICFGSSGNDPAAERALFEHL